MQKEQQKGHWRDSGACEKFPYRFLGHIWTIPFFMICDGANALAEQLSTSVFIYDNKQRPNCVESPDLGKNGGDLCPVDVGIADGVSIRCFCWISAGER